MSIYIEATHSSGHAERFPSCGKTPPANASLTGGGTILACLGGSGAFDLEALQQQGVEMAAALLAGSGGLTLIAAAIKQIYGVAADLGEYLDEHIKEMKGNDNVVIARTGRVLEAAKYGFGLGYLSSTIIIAAGQILLGNTFSAIVTVATAVTLTNPIAMTCAAVGAIFYGWHALSDRERNEILEKLSHGLQVGVELLKSVLGFVIDKTKELLSSKNIEEIKRFIAEGAAVFGRTLGSVTHRVTDIVGDAFDTARHTADEAMGKTAEIASGAYVAISDGAVAVGKQVRARIGREDPLQDGARSAYVPTVDEDHVRPAVLSKAGRLKGIGSVPSARAVHQGTKK